MSKTIALLVISTTKGRDQWKTMKDTYLYNLTLKTFLLTANSEYKYVVYIGIDKNDRILDKKNEQEVITNFSKVFQNTEFKFIVYDNNKVAKGHATKMWNIIFQQAYDEGCEYFYQCGDDMTFKTKGWVKDSIEMLEKHNNIGLTGPTNNNQRILTQSFVSRTHMEIFGWYFPEEIKNWCCDDWYNFVYQPDNFYPLKDHFCSNDGGEPRYDINNDPNFKGSVQQIMMGNNPQVFRNNLHKLRQKTENMAQSHKRLLNNYLMR